MLSYTLELLSLVEKTLSIKRVNKALEPTNSLQGPVLTHHSSNRRCLFHDEISGTSLVRLTNRADYHYPLGQAVPERLQPRCPWHRVWQSGLPCRPLARKPNCRDPRWGHHRL